MNSVVHNQPQEFIHTFCNQQLVNMKREYIQGVNRNLAQQQAEGALARNILLVLDNTLKTLAAQVQQQGLIVSQSVVELPLIELVHNFTETAIRHNRSSCALSNFPAEHNPDGPYLTEIAKKTAEKLQVFCQSI